MPKKNYLSLTESKKKQKKKTCKPKRKWKRNKLKRRKQLKEFEKGKIIAYMDQKLSKKAIAQKLKRHRNTIHNFLREFKSSGKVKRKKRRGDKQKTSSVIDKKIVKLALKKRRITTTQIKKELKLNVSLETVRRRLHKAGLSSKFAIQKPFISEENIAKRLSFARKYVKKPKSFWKRVLFIDESAFTMRNLSKKRVWLKKSERFKKSCLQGILKGSHTKKVMVWACFSANGVGKIYRVDGRMNQYLYKTILKHQMYPSAKKLFPNNLKNFIILQDNSSIHTADSIKLFFKNKKQKVLDFPPQSPDLNPIENLWKLLDDSISTRKPKNLDELFLLIKKAWKKLSIETLENLAYSMQKRLKLVIENKGGSIKY